MLKEIFFGKEKKSRPRRAEAPKAKTKPNTELWALQVADEVLTKKTVYKGVPRFRVNFGSLFSHPHVFGALLDESDEAKVVQAVGFVDDVENALSRRGYKGQVSIRLRPLRIEIVKPEAPVLNFANYWPAIKAGSVNELRFNGALFYQGSKEHMIGPSIAQPPYTHVVFTGATRSGKTVLSFNCLLSLAYRNSPEILSIVLCDRKGLNLKLLNNLPHVPAPCAVNELDISEAVRRVFAEMRRRAQTQDRSHSKKHILLVIDEMDNTFSADKDVENLVIAIAKEGAEWGIHLFLIGQKLAGNADVNLYQNLSTRFVGSTGGNRSEASINSGPDSQAHKLPTGQGIFEFVNGGTLLGDATPVLVRSMYIPDPDRNVPRYVSEIRQRWQGTNTHWNLGGWKPSATAQGARRATEATLMAILSQRCDEGPLKPSYVVRVYRELTGKSMSFAKARRILMGLSLDDEDLCYGTD